MAMPERANEKAQRKPATRSAFGLASEALTEPPLARAGGA
jgi:hypothetical protein